MERNAEKLMDTLRRAPTLVLTAVIRPEGKEDRRLQARMFQSGPAMLQEDDYRELVAELLSALPRPAIEELAARALRLRDAEGPPDDFEPILERIDTGWGPRKASGPVDRIDIEVWPAKQGGA